MAIRLMIEQVGGEEDDVSPLEVRVSRESGKLKIGEESMVFEGYSLIDVEYREDKPVIKVVYGIEEGDYNEVYQKKIEARDNDIRKIRGIKCIKFKKKRVPSYDIAYINKETGEVVREISERDGSVPFLELVFLGKTLIALCKYNLPNFNIFSL